MSDKELLLSPIQVGTRKCENRFFAQSMECSDADAEGNPSELTYERYENLFKGRFGMIDLEAITITGESRSRLAQLEIMPKNEKALANFIKKLKAVNPDALIVFQLTHAGELSNPEFSRRVSVKNVPGMEGDILSEEEVDHIMDQFVLASKITQDVGADGIDMKFCHGYFGSQILRPYNDRNWKYGGSWEKRSRFAYDLYERIQKEVNDKNFLIGSKVSLWEGFPGGFGSAGPDSPLMDLAEPIDFLKGLEERGAQYFVETIGNVHSTISFVEADKDHPYLSYLHMYFANEMKKHLKPETVVIGGHFSAFRDGKNKLLAVTPEQSSIVAMGAQCINDGMMDMVALGRQSMADPLQPLKMMEGRDNEIKYCTSCLNCLELMIRQENIGCSTFNKRYTKILQDVRNAKGKVQEMHT
ncbi:MAG: 2,4-dienoyl-CoA reductase [Christensenella sp.]|uniref:oxidoreductase n=1 Tax=Christensenella sp. TaxID=1935934 RepID=UPI002B1F7DC8|nr:2,4-dienoyl-CoA reductase [Christensenella sp.]MEA5002584.1 2,4-dienoyl-CoA reductase [Christensenella sp.]